MKKINHRFLIVMAFFSAIFLFTCSDNVIFRSELVIPEANWASDKAAQFETTLTDTAKLYDLRISLNNSPTYKYQNIWLFIKSKSPDNFTHIDTIEVFLAEDDGKWLGHKTGDSYSMKFYYKQKIRFPKTGNYQFEIVQGMRDIQLKGIEKIEFEMLEAN